MKSSEIIDLMQQRQHIYAFLQSIYEKEVTKDFISCLPPRVKPILAIADVFPGAETRQLLKELVEFTETIPSQDLETLYIKLAADYARLFLSTGSVPPHPSESVYLEGPMMQRSRDEVLEMYWSFGIDKRKEFTEPEDHIAVELSFIAYLCSKTINALKSNNTGEAGKYLEAQKEFLEKHLIRWAPKLVKDILSTARTPFYKAIAALTRDYLELDLSAIKGLLKQTE